MTNKVDLDELEKKVIRLLDEYKYPLIQVLRYRDEGRFVPEEIEVPVKYIIKNFQHIRDNNQSTYTFPDFSLTKKDNDVFLISTTEHPNTLEVKIIQKEEPETKYWSYRRIHYQGNVYEELNLSGNTYNHIVSQLEKMKERSQIDMESWILTPEQRKELIIRDYFHDIPEHKKGDVICSSKTQEHSNDEDVIAEEIIAAQDWSEEEKEKMKNISHMYRKKSLFKLYEIMFYIFDIQKMVQDRNKHNGSSYLAWATLGYQFPRFIKEYEMPNGKIIYWLDVPSCTKHLRENISIIDEAFAHVDSNGIKDSWKTRYEEWKHTRENIIKPYITKND